MALFLHRDFAAARPLFELASGGPTVDLAHAASMHVRMCERRIGGLAPRSPEEQFAYGITLMNEGDYHGAEPVLRRAVEVRNGSGQFHYALALCLGHLGEFVDSLAHLRFAIQLEPANRTRARQDADFQALADPAIRELLRAERS